VSYTQETVIAEHKKIHLAYVHGEKTLEQAKIDHAVFVMSTLDIDRTYYPTYYKKIPSMLYDYLVRRKNGEIKYSALNSLSLSEYAISFRKQIEKNTDNLDMLIWYYETLTSKNINVKPIENQIKLYVDNQFSKELLDLILEVQSLDAAEKRYPVARNESEGFTQIKDYRRHE
jgi:hypothetical protein